MKLTNLIDRLSTPLTADKCIRLNTGLFPNEVQDVLKLTNCTSMPSKRLQKRALLCPKFEGKF
ncbi:hypothetical protein HOLleu_26740 [Holothuria leucospilota]|uniref:Uncharacterized protein n=1 Tax=Holothuria leucospilota TaxID=206669 RepID=A0A9Q1BP25_HOLLE|nr:hypothetical protein HOLleu_26740 [Holothuria leucospilota]